MAKKRESGLQVTKQKISENSIFSLSPLLSQFTHPYLAVRQSKKHVILRTYRLPGVKLDPDTGTDEKLTALN